jgi:hypothetical protein
LICDFNTLASTLAVALAGDLFGERVGLETYCPDHRTDKVDPIEGQQCYQGLRECFKMLAA